MSKTNHESLPNALLQLNQTVQDLCQKTYVSRAPSVFLLLARGLVWLAARIVSIRAYAGPYPAYDKKFLENRSAALRGDLSPELALPFSPYVGRFNPIAPPFKFVIEKAGQLVTAEAVAPVTFAGPPNTVHGGMVAGIFDDLLGAVNWSGENSGFTGTLTVRYHRHTPILKPIKMRAECIKRDGRKTFVKGEIFHDGQLTASAEGIFVQPKGHSAQTAS